MILRAMRSEHVISLEIDTHRFKQDLRLIE